jgi:hypothetical protein
MGSHCPTRRSTHEDLTVLERRDKPMLTRQNNLPQAQGKRVMVTFPGSDRKPSQLLVPHDTTASKLLDTLHLNSTDYVMSKDGSPHNTFGRDEPLYSSLSDGDRLYVTAHVDAGS